MFITYETLPENYECFKKIDMKDSKMDFKMLNILLVIALIPFFMGLIIMGADFTISFWGILLFILGYILSIILHELIHAIFFKLNPKVKVKFKFHGFAASASVPDVYFTKKHYYIVCLAPFIILNSILLMLLFFLTGGTFYLVYFLLAMHFSGCVGDLYVFYKMLLMPKRILIEDYGIGMRFYKANDH